MAIQEIKLQKRQCILKMRPLFRRLATQNNMKIREIIYKPTDQEDEFIGYVNTFGDEVPIYHIFLSCVDKNWYALYYNSKKYIIKDISLENVKQNLLNRLNSPENQ